MIEEFNMVVLRHVIALITPVAPGFVPKGPLQRRGQPTPYHAPITAMFLKNRGFSGVKTGMAGTCRLPPLKIRLRGSLPPQFCAAGFRAGNSRRSPLALSQAPQSRKARRRSNDGKGEIT
ncbi:MAG: hypothetical protein ABGX10_13460 [Paracoccus sp. (in: a-proteobacteria)]